MKFQIKKSFSVGMAMFVAVAMFFSVMGIVHSENRSAHSSDRPWWTGGLRIYHPNMSALDLLDMDANAVVISAGGLVAFYPSQIAGHNVSLLLEGRDFLREVIPRAHEKGLKVVARIDFSAKGVIQVFLSTISCSPHH